MTHAEALKTADGILDRIWSPETPRYEAGRIIAEVIERAAAEERQIHSTEVEVYEAGRVRLENERNRLQAQVAALRAALGAIQANDRKPGSIMAMPPEIRDGMDEALRDAAAAAKAFEDRVRREAVESLGTASQLCAHVEFRTGCVSCFNRRLEKAEKALHPLSRLMDHTQAVAKAVAEERERCASKVEDWDFDESLSLAKAIRSGR